MPTIVTRYLLAATLVFVLIGCEREGPTSYLIPKEEREVTMPGTAAEPAPAKQAPSLPAPSPAPASSGSNMQILPGMEEAANQAGDVRYSVPEGWEELAPSGIRKANLKVTDANGSAELTVLVFPGDVGGPLANINRWRGQIGLDPSSPEAFAELTETYTISAHPGLYVRLEGEAQSILGGLLPFHGDTWFFKFLGDSDTVLANEAKMKTFLDSVKLADDNH